MLWLLICLFPIICRCHIPFVYVLVKMCVVFVERKHESNSRKLQKVLSPPHWLVGWLLYLSIYLSMYYIFEGICDNFAVSFQVCIHLTLLSREKCETGSIFKLYKTSLNSVFFLFITVCKDKSKYPSLPNYLTVKDLRNDWYMPLARIELQITSFRFWTCCRKTTQVAYLKTQLFTSYLPKIPADISINHRLGGDSHCMKIYIRSYSNKVNIDKFILIFHLLFQRRFLYSPGYVFCYWLYLGFCIF